MHLLGMYIQLAVEVYALHTDILQSIFKNNLKILSILLTLVYYLIHC